MFLLHPFLLHPFLVYTKKINKKLKYLNRGDHANNHPTPSPNYKIDKMSSLSNASTTYSKEEQYKNDPLSSSTANNQSRFNNNTCSNCEQRLVAHKLSCAVYKDWCAFCNLTLLSTAPN